VLVKFVLQLLLFFKHTVVYSSPNQLSVMPHLHTMRFGFLIAPVYHTMLKILVPTSTVGYRVDGECLIALNDNNKIKNR